MRWLALYLRSRGAWVAVAVAVGAVALVWGAWSWFSDARTVNARAVTLTVMLGVAAFARTLDGPDESLDRTAAVRWPLRRFVHVLVLGAVIVGLLMPTLLTGARFEPATMVLRNTAGLLGLTALGAALVGAALCWVAPLTWTVVSVLPILDASSKVGWQVVGWLVQPTGTTAATACAVVLAVSGLAAYSWRGAGL
ncbi:hypothetical protein [Virgisporangium aurantiacum]|uniref:Uncharacterized protein n=1 Tax=Virgisporangium aurantiacum TaxID=175570 RepID=A0A8J4E496_9ACTN|nr:hypothetical protein [Virgisporangium aurantiacum]GIJ60986.1 hypothetical protein Vau01_085020 [Virgisporangium aurantiacum]